MFVIPSLTALAEAAAINYQNKRKNIHIIFSLLVIIYCNKPQLLFPVNAFCCLQGGLRGMDPNTLAIGAARNDIASVTVRQCPGTNSKGIQDGHRLRLSSGNTG